MSNYPSSSQATLESDYIFYSFLPENLSSISNASASSSHRLQPTTSIAKPKPVMTKQALRRLGYHPPYQLDATAYLRYDSLEYDEYTFKGTHVSPLSTEENTYYTSVFESSGDLTPVRYTFDVEEDHRQDRCWYQAPKFFVWFRTLFCAFIWFFDIALGELSSREIWERFVGLVC